MISIPGYSSAIRTPGFYALLLFGAGLIGGSLTTRYLLLVGTKATGAGSATVDVDVVTIASEDDADTYFGAGGELAQMAYIAVQYGIPIKAAAVAPNGTTTAATLTITFTGTWTAGGTYSVRVGGQRIDVTVSSAFSVTQMAAAVASAIQAKTRFPASATSSAGVVTLTMKSVGLRGNDWALYQDTTQAPSGLVATLGGAGGALTGTGRRFGGGTGQDDITNLVAVLSTDQYYTIAAATSAASGSTDPNAARWKAAEAAKSAVGVQIYEQYCFGHNGARADAIALGQTTLNDQIASVAWAKGHEQAPCQLAASYGALRHLYETDQPNSNFDGLTLKGIVPHAAASDRPTGGASGDVETALAASVTPITSTSYDARVVRAIGCHSLNGASPDYRTLDVGESRVPQRAVERIQLKWTSEYAPANPYVNSDPADGEPNRPDGVATPSLWNANVEGLLRDMERDLWITDVSSHKPVSEFDAAQKSIRTSVNVVTLPINHSTGLRLAQYKAA